MNTADQVVSRIHDIRASKGDDIPDVVLSFLAELEALFTRDAWVPANRLFGVKELAELFSVGRSTITGWAYSDTARFPEPILRLGSGPVWDAYDVVQWWNAWVPRKGVRTGIRPHVIPAWLDD